MNYIDFARQFLTRYYPRQHLVAAGFLSLLLVFLLIVSASDTSPATRYRDQPVRLMLSGLQQDSDDSPALPDSLADQESRSVAAPVPVYPAPSLATSGEIERSPGPDMLPPVSTDSPAAATWQHLEVKSGDNLSSLFKKVGLSDRELYHLLNSNDEAKVLNRIFPGYQLSFLIPKPGQLEQLKVLKSPLEGYLFTLIDGFYDVESIVREPEIRQVFKHGTITDSLFLAGQREDIPPLTIMEMADIFGGVIDFILDPRLGDHFSLLFEEHYLDGELVGTGNIIAAQFTNQDEQHIAVQYQDLGGEYGYYNQNGESMRKVFLRTPLDVFRISSNFSLARRHPILNTIRAHKGTDYAAPKGTPVRATSDGTVTWAARNGTFGNLVVVKHRGGFETKYAHLNGYAKGVKKGSRVRQGDVIGYVGATGSATGPHLHYEFLVNGQHQNPRTVLDRLPQAVSVPDEELERFRRHAAPLLDQFAELEQTYRLFAQRQSSAD